MLELKNKLNQIVEELEICKKSDDEQVKFFCNQYEIPIEFITMNLKMLTNKINHNNNISEHLVENNLCLIRTPTFATEFKKVLSEWLSEKELLLLDKIGGFISGSLLFKTVMQVLHDECNFEPNDIDIFIPQKSRFDEWRADVDFFVNELYKKGKDNSSYSCMYDDILDILGSKKIEINNKIYNIIFYNSNKTPDELVNSFDLECCRMFYQKNNIYMANMKSLLMRKSSVKPNKVSIDNLYSPNNEQRVRQDNFTTLRYSKDFAMLATLFDVYQIVEHGQQYCALHKYMDKQMNEMKILSAANDLQKYKNDLVKIQEQFDIYRLFENFATSKKYTNIFLIDQNIIDALNLIRCYYRMNKYSARGIDTFEIILDNDSKHESN